MRQRYAELAKDRLLNIKARVKQKSFPRILTFKNRVNGVLSNRDITDEDFVLEVYKSPFLERTENYIFQLTVGSGLTVQGDDNEQLLIEVTAAQATQRPDVYFWLLISNGEEVAWLNGDWEFFNGKYDGPITETTEIIIAATDEGDEIVIEISGDSGDLSLYELKSNTPVALVDAATIDIASPQNTLASSASTRTFTISSTDDVTITIVTLSATSATYTFPATALCIVQGTASGDNTATLSGVSGDKYIIAILKSGSEYTVIILNKGQ